MRPHFDSPAPLERVRCAIARHLYLHHLHGVKLSLRITPRAHPWRQLISSTYDETRDLTKATLYPRNPDGSVETRLVLRAPVAPTVSFTALASSFAVRALVAYVALDLFSTRVPGPLGKMTEMDESIRIFSRLAQAGTAFLA